MWNFNIWKVTVWFSIAIPILALANRVEKYYASVSLRLNLGILILFFKELGPSAVLRAIKMCLRPTDANADNIPQLLVSLGCTSGTNITSGIIFLLKD